MFGHPGKKHLFMGDEFGQRSEWNHDASLDWHLLENPRACGPQALGARPEHPVPWPAGAFRIGFRSTPVSNGWTARTLSGASSPSCGEGSTADDLLLFVCNFTPVVRSNYRVGVPFGTVWKEMLNSDAPLYGGSGQGNFGAVSGDSAPHSRAAILAYRDAAALGRGRLPARA